MYIIPFEKKYYSLNEIERFICAVDFTLDYDHTRRYLSNAENLNLGLVKRGTIKVNQMVSCCRVDGSIKQFRIAKMFGFIGLKRIEIDDDFFFKGAPLKNWLI